jgi:hypothetical protein
LRLMDLGEDEEMTDLPDKTYLRSEHHAYVLIFIQNFPRSIGHVVPSLTTTH